MLAAPLIRRAAMIAAIAMPAALFAQDPPKPAAAAKRPTVVRVKDAPVEVKYGAEWKKATFKNVADREWALVAYETGGQEWVEPWRLRPLGSDYDIPDATPNPPATVNEKGVLSRPPRVRPGPPPSAASSEDAAPLPIDWPVTTVDAAAVPEVAPAAAAQWAYAPAAFAAPKLRDTSLSLLGGMQTDGSDAVIALEAGGNVALIGYQSKSEPKVPVAEVLDLVGGKPLSRVELNPATRPLSVSPDGKRLVARAEGAYAGTMTRLDLWDLPGVGRDPAKHVVSFEPFAKEASKDVARAFAIDAEHVITVNPDGAVVAWQVASGSAKPLWRTRLADADVALSPDRRVLAGLGKGGLLLINVADGKVAGAIETPVRSAEGLSFRGDGKRLTVLAASTVFEFDLEAGKQTASIGLPSPLLETAGVRHLAGDVVLLIEAPKSAAANPLKSTALDVARGALLAQYTTTGIDATGVVGDRLVGMTRRGAQRALSSWGLAPTGGAALAVVPNGPETRASVDVHLEVDEFARRAIVDALRKQVTARGWTLVEPSQPANVRVVARLEQGAPEPRSFLSSIGKRENRTVVPNLSRLVVEVDGQTAWRAEAKAVPVVVPPGPAEQMEKAYAEAAQRPNIAFLKNTPLPATLFAPIGALPQTVPQQTLAAAATPRGN